MNLALTKVIRTIGWWRFLSESRLDSCGQNGKLEANTHRHTHTHTDTHPTAHSHNQLYGSLRDCFRSYKSKIQISWKSCFHLMNNLFESIFDENYLKVAMKWNMVINLDMWCCPNIEWKIWKPFVAKKGFQRLLTRPPYWASALSLSLDCLDSSPLPQPSSELTEMSKFWQSSVKYKTHKHQYIYISEERKFNQFNINSKEI